MNATENGGDSEKLQIAILTFFMTAGGFLVLTLAFGFYLNPKTESRMQAAEGTYEGLTRFLAEEEMRRLRQQDRESQENENTQDLREIISRNMTSFGLEFRDFPAPRRPSMQGGPSGIQEIVQKITLQPASMAPILQFIATVADAKKSIRVAAVDLNANKRGVAADADSWTASVDFVDYEMSAAR